MRALRLLAWQSDPVLVEVDDPIPGPGQVIVRIGGAGACHSDLHLMHDFTPGQFPWKLPFTLGHENAGWVHSVGSGVTGYDIGQPVAVYGPWGCGVCARCRLGMENYCEHPDAAPQPGGGGGGLGSDGGMADLMLVPSARHLLPLPDGLDPVVAAPLTDAGLTPYHAIRRSWPKLTPGTTAVVIGAGGLGHLAVQILAATTATRIIAVDQRDDAIDLAIDSGAELGLKPDATAAADIRTMTSGKGADVVLDFVGTSDTMALGVAIARTLADLTVVGLAGGSMQLSFFTVPYELSVQTTYWGSRPELIEVLELGARRLIRPTIATYPLARALQAYHHLDTGVGVGRQVIVPSMA